MELNKIISGDCIQIMRKMPSNSVDLIVTDPPYGDDISYYGNKTIENNENPLVNCLALVECYRILKKNKTLYNFTNWKHLPFLNEFIMRYTKFKIKHVIVWKKPNFGMGYAFRHQFELILVLEKGDPKYNLTNFSNVQESKHISAKSAHPHQKPLDLLNKIIKHSSNEEEIVFDPFCGSGSTCISALLNKRKWIGIEKDPKYVQLAKTRLENSGRFDESN
ncbi:MAG: DNA-methyltransferase [Candidatus Pacearchaeota archaeon]